MDTPDCPHPIQAVLDCSHPIPDTPDCPHYLRGCLLRAPCCGRFVACRFCHDESAGGCEVEFPRKEVEEVMCKRCSLVQPIGGLRCSGCDAQFATYYCPSCRLYDSSGEDKYHCDQCGICRKGKKEDSYHCEGCDMCYRAGAGAEGHVCSRGRFRDNCAICMCGLFDSLKPVTSLPLCGHLLHSGCLEGYARAGNYRCPLCRKSVADLSAYWAEIDERVALEVLPEELRRQVEVVCADCEWKGETEYHLDWLKCLSCGSYNTARL